MTDVGWRRVQLPGGVSIALPSGLSAEDAQGVDSLIQTWSGNGIDVLIDTGPMADRLNRYEGSEEEFSGRLARVADFDDAGIHVFAVHFDDPALTITVRIEHPEDESIARAILESLRIDR